MCSTIVLDEVASGAKQGERASLAPCFNTPSHDSNYGCGQLCLVLICTELLLTSLLVCEALNNNEIMKYF